MYSVETVTGHQISLAGSHYIRVEHNDYLPASQLTLNHSLYIAHIGHAVRIRTIKKEFKLGLYNPLTLSGTLLVNSILASSYVSVNNRGSHDYAHRLMAPLRWWYYMIKKILGFDCQVYSTPEHGIHWLIAAYLDDDYYFSIIYRALYVLFVVVIVGLFTRAITCFYPIGNKRFCS